MKKLGLGRISVTVDILKSVKPALLLWLQNINILFLRTSTFKWKHIIETKATAGINASSNKNRIGVLILLSYIKHISQLLPLLPILLVCNYPAHIHTSLFIIARRPARCFKLSNFQKKYCLKVFFSFSVKKLKGILYLLSKLLLKEETSYTVIMGI